MAWNRIEIEHGQSFRNNLLANMLGLWLYKVEGRRTLHFSILVWGQVREYQTPPHSLTTLRSMVMENGKTYCGHILSEHSSIDIRLVDIII